MEYRIEVAGVDAHQLEGFFDGWPSPPTPERHLAILRGSSHIVLASEGPQITGFVDVPPLAYLLREVPKVQRKFGKRHG